MPHSTRCHRQLCELRPFQYQPTTSIRPPEPGAIDLLHLPGELFVEYQLAAPALRPESSVYVAAYGDYGPGYVGLHDAYAQGGYETSARASRLAPSVEGVLMKGIGELLE